MKRFAQSVVLALVMIACSPSFSEDVPDGEIARKVVLSCMFEDDWRLARSVFDNAFAATGSDRDRFARILCEVAHTNDARIAEGMVSRLISYGTTAQLPFLYSQTTNANHGVWAVKAILAIEGVTSNSVAIVDSYLSNTNIYPRERSELCGMFFANVMSTNLSSELRRSVEEVSLRYARSSNMYFRRMDRAMTVACPSYENSKRRLAVLRSVYQLGVSEYQIAYVTNAINELVAYPEADLPE